MLNSKGAYGLAQWNGPRQTTLQAFATAKGLPVSAIDTQLAFVLTESANSYPPVWAAIQQAGINYTNFIPIFVEHYENPANPTAEIAGAQAFAVALYPAVPAAVALSPAPAPAPTPAPTPSTPSAPTVVIPALAPTPPSAPPTQSFVMDPVLAALLTTVIEAIISGILKGTVAQVGPAATTSTTVTPVTITTPVATVTAAPTIDINSLVNTLAPLLTSSLSTGLPALIAAELSKITVPATK